MKSLSTLLSVASLATAPSSVSALRWKLKGSSCDGSPFKNVNIGVTCNGSSSCGLGDTATVSGTVYAKNAFDDDAQVNLQACIVSSYWCPKEASKDAGSICDWLTATDNQSCGQVGNYAVSWTEDIPSSDQVSGSMYSFAKSLVIIVMKVGDEEECEADADGSNMSYSAIGLASLALIGAAYAAKKRRRDGDNDDEKATAFVEMGGSAAVV